MISRDSKTGGEDTVDEVLHGQVLGMEHTSVMARRHGYPSTRVPSDAALVRYAVSLSTKQLRR